MTTRVDVVVLAWNDGALLDRAVASALASTDVDVRVVIVDNGSEPPVPQPQDPRVDLVRNPVNRGVAAGRAQGIARSDAPFVCLLDSDARLAPDCLAALLGALDESGVALSAPVFTGQLPEAGAGRAPTVARKVARALGLTDQYAEMPRGVDDRVWEVEFAIGACQLVRRHAHDAVGGLDQTIFYGPEDVDFCLRLRAAGWRVVQVDAQCEHPPRRRHRRLLTRRGWAHARAVARHQWRHRRRVDARVRSRGMAA